MKRGLILPQPRGRAAQPAEADARTALRGLVVNLATGSPDEVVSFRAASFDRAPGARIYTFNLRDELPGAAGAEDLARLALLVEQRRLVAPVELEAPWEDIGRAIGALLSRHISGKAVLHVGVQAGSAGTAAL